MRYYDDMTDKHGFSDGEAIPPDAEACRALYVRAINAVAASRNCAQRATAYDRAGLHNWCMLLFYPAADIPPGYDVTSGNLPDATPVLPDDDMREVLDAVNELNVDQYVTTRVTTRNREYLHAMARHLAPLRTR